MKVIEGMNQAVLLMIAVVSLLIPPPLVAETSANLRSFDTVAKIAAVTTRDGSGRAQRFTDAGNREFAVTYNAQQRVQSVEATRGPHINDIVSVGYAPDGKLVGVRFRTGCSMFFDTQPNGTQVIRDSDGGALIRTERTTQPVDSAAAEPVGQDCRQHRPARILAERAGATDALKAACSAAAAGHCARAWARALGGLRSGLREASSRAAADSVAGLGA